MFAQGASGTDDEGEINAIESMVTQGVQGDRRSRPPAPTCRTRCRRPWTRGIKVILVDNDIPDWDGKTSVVATDNHAGGVLAGQFMAEQLSAGDTIAVLEGVAGAPSLQARVDGFKEGLGDGFDIVASLPTDCDQTKGLDAAQDILTANPDVTAIYGACGPPIIGALEAVADAGSSALVVGFDAGPDEVAAIAAGDRAGVGRPVPRQDGIDGGPGGARRDQRRRRRTEHRHRHGDGDRRERRRLHGARRLGAGDDGLIIEQVARIGHW